MTWQITMENTECSWKFKNECLRTDNDTTKTEKGQITERGICRKDYCPIKLHDGGFVSDDFEFDVPF
ncbi:MAG: hypothetical protein ACOCQA_01900 [bacterium]